MAYSLQKTASLTCDPTAKNRVWDFFDEPTKPRPANRPRTQQPRRKNRPCSYKTASGRPYWPSRDPIGEIGGINLYGFVGNDGVNMVDIKGNYGWQFTDAFGRPLPGTPGYRETKEERERREEAENLRKRRQQDEDTKGDLRKNAKCCDQTKRDEGEKTLNDQYQNTKSSLRKSGIIGTGRYFYENPGSSCYEQAVAVLGGFKIPDCWECKLVNAGKLGGAFDHWWVECTSFDEDGKDKQTLIFDAYHDRPGGPDPKKNRDTYDWEQPVSDDDFSRCQPSYMNPNGCK